MKKYEYLDTLVAYIKDNEMLDPKNLNPKLKKVILENVYYVLSPGVYDMYQIKYCIIRYIERNR